MITDKNGNQHPETEAESVAKIAREGLAPQLHEFAKIGVPVIVLPKTGEVKSLEHLLDLPRRPRASVTVRDHQSFVDYVARHKGPGTIIFAEVKESGGSFTAIIDYHEPVLNPTGETPAHWGEHVCSYVCEFTPEWKRWSALSGKGQNQAAMALFIEENMFDIATPAPAEMLELVKTLEATQGVQFKSALRLDNGDRQLAYAVQTGAKAGEKGDLVIPQKFRLRFGIFRNGPAYDIDCRFRYNIGDGNLVMAFEIERPHKLIDLALIDAQVAIRETLKLPVLLGSGSVSKPTS